MVHRVLKIGRWVVDFLFATNNYDEDGVLGCLYDAHAPGGVIDRALEIMQDNHMNAGFTYPNPYAYRAVVVIGPTTSGEEFTNTLVHEIHHLAVAIASNLGIDLEGETPAYISGDLALALADVVCSFGCSCNHGL